ncbi:transglutaminase TgpA family protein [Hydrogenophilus thiooxidans]|uniref:transglutaminase TgpA family protein n=1 Tax=Hydrogenophilus thiooxidans TaxID=2820326 RepID=UPI001C226813|nr:transglutaminaseTgpA domain-containing protein [Hydrogenophilus thiooxidans]
MSGPSHPSGSWIRQAWPRVASMLTPPTFPVAAWVPCVAAGALAWGLHAAALPLLWNGVVALLLVGTLARFLFAVRWPRWLPTGVALAAFAAIRPIYGYGFGQETGLALLFAAFWLKGWEATTARDLRGWGLTALFLLAAAFLRSQSPLYAAAVLTGWLVVVVGWAQAARVEWGLATALRQLPTLARHTAVTLIASLPLVLLLFVLVPRLDRPLWGVPQDATQALSGLSETIAPGAVSALALSDAVAFTLTWEEAAPAPSELYFRAVVLPHYDGTTWRPAPEEMLERQSAQPRARATPATDVSPAAVRTPAASDRPHQSPAADAVRDQTAPSDAPFATRRFSLLLAPQPIPWLPVPERTVALVGAAGARPWHDGRWLSDRPLLERTLWSGDVQLTDRWPESLTATQARQLTALPPNQNPRAQALGQRIAREHPSAAARLAAIEDAFRAANLRYTLYPPLMTDHAADQTLFDVQAGFCEHFANAFAVVARAAGLPTRLVAGYQGATFNPVDRSWVVRHADAHAWAEVWLDGEWRRVDPTRWTAPERITLGSDAALRSELPLVRAAWLDQPWLAALRQRLWAWQRQWDLWVVGFDAARQRALLARFGWESGDWRWAVSGALLIAAATALILFARLPQPPRDPVHQAWARLTATLARRDLAPRPGEAPLAYVARAGNALPSPLAARFTALAQRYLAYRFGAATDAPHHLARDLRQLRWALICAHWPQRDGARPADVQTDPVPSSTKQEQAAR